MSMLTMEFDAKDFKQEWSDEELKAVEKAVLKKYPDLKDQLAFTSSSSVAGSWLCGSKEYTDSYGYSLQGILLDNNGNPWEMWDKDNDSRVAPLKDQMQSNYYVTMTDTMLSGWGEALDKKNKLIILCDTYDQAEVIADNAEKRDEMKSIKIGSGLTPRYSDSDYKITFRRYKDLGEVWTKKNEMKKINDSKKQAYIKSKQGR